MRRTRALAGLVVVCAAAGLSAQSGTAPKYQTPPQAIVEILDAKPLAQAELSPARDVLALFERVGLPPIAELAEPMLRLAGTRLSPRTNGTHRAGDSVGLVLKSIADGAERRVVLPPGGRLQSFDFSPDGSAHRPWPRRADAHRAVARRREDGEGARHRGRRSTEPRAQPRVRVAG